MRLKGDRGGVHFLKAFLLGGPSPKKNNDLTVNRILTLTLCHETVQTLPSLRDFPLK